MNLEGGEARGGPAGEAQRGAQLGHSLLAPFVGRLRECAVLRELVAILHLGAEKLGWSSVNEWAS